MVFTSFDKFGAGTRVSETTSQPRPIIKYSRWGLASRSGNLIILHKGLQKRENWLLRRYLLQHELQHSQGEAGWKDVLHDLRSSWDLQYQWRVFWYVLWHPGSWLMYSPIRPFNGSIGIDTTHLTILALFLVTFIMAYLFLY